MKWCHLEDETNFHGALKQVASELGLNYSTVRTHYNRVTKRAGKDPLGYEAREQELVDIDFL